MSNVLFEAAVRIRPETGGFAAEAQQEIQNEINQIRPEAGGPSQATRDIDALLQRVRATKAEATAFLSAMTSGASSFGGAMNEALTLIAEGRKLTNIGEVDFGGQKLIAARNLLEDIGRAGRVPVETLRDLEAAFEANRKKSVDLNAEQRLLQQGFETTGQAAGRAFSPLRIGLFAAAFTSVFVAIGQVRQALKETGDEAFTTAGRTKNALSAALGGDIIGAFQALSAQESRLAPDLEKAGAALKVIREEASRISLRDVTEQSDAFEQHLQDLRDDLESMGIGTADVASFTADYRHELELAAAAARDNSKAIGEIEEAIKRAGSAAAAFGEQQGEFGRGPGAIDRSNALENLSGGTGPSGEIQFFSDLPPGLRAAILREQGPGGTEAGLARVLRQAIADRERRLAELQNLKPKTQELKNRQAEAIVAVRSDLNSFDSQLEQLLKPDDDPSRGRRSFQLPPRFIERETLVAATAGLQDDLKLANDIISFLERQKDVAKRGTDRFREVVVALKAAQAERRAILEDIAAGRVRDREDAAAALRKALGIDEQKLQNSLLAAQLTEAEADDRRALVKLRDFYAAQARNMKLTEEERLRFRAQELQTRARLRQADSDSGGKVDIFAEAVKNFRQFGSNLSEAGSVMSAQDARGQLGALIIRAKNTATEIANSVKFPDTDIGDKRFLNSLRGRGAVDAATGNEFADVGAAAEPSNPVVAATNEAERAQAQRDAQQLAATKEIVEELRRMRTGGPKKDEDLTGSAFGAVVGLARADATHFGGRS